MFIAGSETISTDKGFRDKVNMSNNSDDRIESQIERFWELSEPMMGGPVAEGSMMGSKCIRVNGDFAAMIHSKTGDLIVKLSSEAVLGEIDAGTGFAFAPNGKVFKEWLQVAADDDESWTRLISNAVAFGS